MATWGRIQTLGTLHFAFGTECAFRNVVDDDDDSSAVTSCTYKHITVKFFFPSAFLSSFFAVRRRINLTYIYIHGYLGQQELTIRLPLEDPLEDSLLADQVPSNVFFKKSMNKGVPWFEMCKDSTFW